MSHLTPSTRRTASCPRSGGTGPVQGRAASAASSNKCNTLIQPSSHTSYQAALALCHFSLCSPLPKSQHPPSSPLHGEASLHRAWQTFCVLLLRED